MATKGQDQPGAQLAPILATATFACGAICAVPPTSIVGVLLWIGYLGDAVASRLRSGSPLLAAAAFALCLALIIWGALRSRGNNRRTLTPSRR